MNLYEAMLQYPRVLNELSEKEIEGLVDQVKDVEKTPKKRKKQTQPEAEPQQQEAPPEQDPNQQEGDPNAQGDPNQQQEDPNAQGGDPQAQGDPGQEGGDPNAQGDPNQQEGDPNAQEDPNQQQQDPEEENQNKMAAYDKLMYFDKFKQLNKILESFLKIVNNNKDDIIKIEDSEIKKRYKEELDNLNDVLKSTTDQIHFLLSKGIVSLDNENISKIFTLLTKKIKFCLQDYKKLTNFMDLYREKQEKKQNRKKRRKP